MQETGGLVAERAAALDHVDGAPQGFACHDLLDDVGCYDPDGVGRVGEGCIGSQVRRRIEQPCGIRLPLVIADGRHKGETQIVAFIGRLERLAQPLVPRNVPGFAAAGVGSLHPDRIAAEPELQRQRGVDALGVHRDAERRTLAHIRRLCRGALGAGLAVQIAAELDGKMGETRAVPRQKEQPEYFLVCLRLLPCIVSQQMGGTVADDHAEPPPRGGILTAERIAVCDDLSGFAQ